MSKRNLLPAPTSWINRTPEGEPPDGVLLLIKSWPRDVGEDEIAIAAVGVGYYSKRLHGLLSLDQMAIEEDNEVECYHIITDVDGKTIPVDIF